MGAQRGNRREHGIEHPRGRPQATGQRRKQRNASQRHLEAREEPLDVCPRHATHMGVARVVVAKVVPDDGPARFEESPHLPCYAAGHGGIQDGGEDGEEQHQVEGGRLEGQLLGVGSSKVEGGVSAMRTLSTLSEEVNAKEVGRLRPPPGKPGQHIAIATANVQNAAGGEGQERGFAHLFYGNGGASNCLSSSSARSRAGGQRERRRYLIAVMKSPCSSAVLPARRQPWNPGSPW